ncbi:kynureninase [Caldimonas brevitalea]|uniref:Kynureninase n=1 Tax=Caldimonas brevitalea TaxID=413882 RepID=A0A0G3BR70_9BURK|nr:kynureninase [Caldimonas brevitalea]AKJ30488.1 kynureninase [Caldimonas brevitalea]
MTSREDCLARDQADPLACLRGLFDLPDGTLYLDGNSLGVLPKATAARVQEVVRHEWGVDLIKSWNSAGWMDLPRRVGDKIAQLIGAGPGEVVVADSTSVNLYKVLMAAARLQQERSHERRVIVSERSNFPTDLYIAQGVCEPLGWELRLLDAHELEAGFAPDTAILLLTHVNYRTGRMHDMAHLTRLAHECGALAVWDLAHSAGAVPVDLTACEADYAVGCGYKYLNGGPGAPAFVWAHPRHADRFAQPLSGWLGHVAPFEFSPHYTPAPGIARYLCGTPPVLSLAALECGVDTVLAAEPHGGLSALRAKSLALSELFVQLVDTRCAGHGLTVVSPRDAGRRGSQVCLSRAEGGYAVVQALIARGVIGDFRAGDSRTPDILRFGLTPLYTRYVDVWDAVEHLRQVLQDGEWQRPEFHRRQAVT